MLNDTTLTARTGSEGSADGASLSILRFHCTTCPSECLLTIEVARDEDGHEQALNISGNRCPRGCAFAEQEITCPMRILATTVAVRGGSERLIPIRTSEAIPRDLHLQAMERLRKLEVSAPIRMGDVLERNILDTGADIVASMDVDAL